MSVSNMYGIIVGHRTGASNTRTAGFCRLGPMARLHETRHSIFEPHDVPEILLQWLYLGIISVIYD